jgi:hypothetical protein
MLQTFIYLLFINPLFYSEIDTMKLVSFDIKGDEYFFGGFNEVFMFKNDSIKRVDHSVDSRVTIDAYIFELNDTVIKYGGYGYWSQRNFMYYFDTTSLEWELYRINYLYNPEGSYSGFQNSMDDLVIFYGGKRVNPKKRIESLPSEEIILFNKKNKKLDRLGTLSFYFLNKKHLCSTKNLSFFYDNEFFYKVDPFKNKVSKYFKPSVFLYDIFKSSFDERDNVFRIKKIIYKTGGSENIILDAGFLRSPIDEYELYKTPSNSFIYFLLIIMFVVIFIIFKNHKKNKTVLGDTYLIHNKSKYDFDIEDLSVLRQLVIQNEIQFNDVMSSYQKSSLSYGHNTRVSNEKLDKLSIRLKSIFKLKDQPILKKKSNVDKRQKIIVLSEEFREIKIVLK